MFVYCFVWRARKKQTTRTKTNYAHTSTCTRKKKVQPKNVRVKNFELLIWPVFRGKKYGVEYKNDLTRLDPFSDYFKI